MRNMFLILTLTLAVSATACGDDTTTTVPTTTVPTTTVPTTTVPTTTVPDDGPILGAGPYPVADLAIAVTMTEDGDERTYRITCLGDTATLTGDDAPANADTMCLALADDAVQSRIIDGDPGDRACTEEWGGPETARITGTFDGADVDTDFHRNNGCGIGDWALLDHVLPLPS